MVVFMEEKITFSAILHEEDLDGKNVLVVNCVELGVSDFGDTVDESLNNLRKGISLLLEEAPEKKELLVKEEPVLITRVLL